MASTQSSSIYRGSKTREISFPLGGIGTGCIGLAGNGRLVDWEIFGKPNKGSTNGFSHFAIKAEADGKVLGARAIMGDLQPPYSGGGPGTYSGFGFGPDRSTMAGVPHFEDFEFDGRFPVAAMQFHHQSFPGRVSMTATNPFIPGNDQDSTIPAAFFELSIENTSTSTIDYTFCLSLNNPLPAGSTINTHSESGSAHIIKLSTNRFKGNEPESGDLCIAVDTCGTGVDDVAVSWQEYWYRGSWFDSLGIFWRDFTSFGPLVNRTYITSYDGTSQPAALGNDVASLAITIKVPPGKMGTARFVISWNFPNAVNYWNPIPQTSNDGQCCEGSCCGSASPETNRLPSTWKHYYATIFNDSTASALYSLSNWDRLWSGTLQFRDALFATTAPEVVLDAVSANISILKTPTTMRLEDGSFYGFEGCHCKEGCCEGSCTHVWNYAYALPFLFPNLERSMRELDYRYNQRDDGGMCFRLQLPIGRGLGWRRACADGQFGGVLKVYREWKISGNDDWMASLWPAVKRCIEFAWTPTNEDKWDPEKKGILTGRQHHTLDVELFGPNSWLTGFYLAALKAGAEMADFMGECDVAAEYRAIFERGKAWVDKELFNGEYYHQLIDISDKSVLEPYAIDDPGVMAYWNGESKELKYQIAQGCGIDQVLAQWHANLVGLGEIFDKTQTLKALQSIFENNYKANMRDFFNAMRIFATGDEAGTVICDWPEGRYKPVVPIVYAEETMHGFEYQVAVHMMQEGLVEEGLKVVQAIRRRYDGERRNPWNEIECGSNYARSMASYALLLAISGFTYDMRPSTKSIGFSPMTMPGQTPLIEGGRFCCFWSIGTSWGTYEAASSQVTLAVLSGELSIKSMNMPFLAGRKLVSAVLRGTDVGSDKPIDGILGDDGKLTLDLTLRATQKLVIALD